MVQPSQRDSSYKTAHLYLCRQGNEPYHEELPSRYCECVHAALCSRLSLRGVQVLPEAWAAPHCLPAAVVMGLATAGGCFCENSVTQNQCQLRKKTQDCV